MAKVTYVFGDILTGTILEEISMYGVSMSRGIGMGDLRSAFQLDQTGKSNSDLIAATEPGRSYLVVERDGQPVWDGMVWTRTYQSQAKVLQLYCRAWEHYPERRLIRSDFLNEDVDQRNIFRNLWLDLLDTDNTPQVEVPSAFSDVVLKTLDIKSFEFKTYREAIDTLSNADDGFDWTIDTARVGGAYVRSLRVGYPTLGAVLPTYFDYPGNILNYWQNDTLSERGTNIFGLGAGEGSTMLVQEVIHSDLLTAGFPRFDVEVSLKSVNSAELLTSLTLQQAVVRKPTSPVITAEIRADREPPFGGYGLGDAAELRFDDPRHPDGTTFTSRILGWEYYPPSSERNEEVRLVFEGEDI